MQLKSVKLKSFFLVAAFSCHMLSTNAETIATPHPVLVELFTSEGCSSCPPADKLLSELRSSNPNVIVLGEHVDYWNSLGWKDSFSSSEFTQRQQSYCQKLGVNSPYTPQIVIDGKHEFVGSNGLAIRSAIRSAERDSSVLVQLQITNAGPNAVNAQAKFDGSKNMSDVLFFLVQDGVNVDVRSGENGGRRLRHDGVVRSVKRVNNPRGEGVILTNFSLPEGIKRKDVRLVAVVEDESGPRGAAQVELGGI